MSTERVASLGYGASAMRPFMAVFLSLCIFGVSALVATPDANAQSGDTLECKPITGNYKVPVHPGGLGPTGTVRVAVLFIDFPDAAGPGSPSEQMASYIEPAGQYIEDLSGGRVDLSFTAVDQWLTMSQESSTYSLRSTGNARTSFTQEAVALADPLLNFANLDSVLMILTDPLDTPGGLAFGTFASEVVADGQPLDRFAFSHGALPSVAAHELLHNFGLPDLYDIGSGESNWVGVFDPMSSVIFMPEMLSFQKWRLGWIDDSQISCVEGTTQQGALTAVGVPGDTKAMITRLDNDRFLVVEARAPFGRDTWLAKTGATPEVGLLVYVVDTSVSTDAGPIRVFRNGTPAGLVPFVEALIPVGEWAVVEGRRIEALSASNGVIETLIDFDPCLGLTITVDLNTGSGMPTAGHDVILGTPGPDFIDGLEGDDIICGRGGNDTIIGGPGNDTLSGGSGVDVIRGGPGVDTIDGGPGNDRLLGGIGDDTLNGGEGDDYLGGFGGADIINGGPGNETIYGGYGADTIDGGSGNDTIRGLIGNDIINGGDGNDRLYGDRGNDTINGGRGSDIIDGGNANDILSGDGGNDEVNGGKADDTLSGGTGTDVCTGNLQTTADTADTTCEAIFGVP